MKKRNYGRKKTTAGKNKVDYGEETGKIKDLAKNTVVDTNPFLRTGYRLHVHNDQNLLKAGSRCATLMEDFISCEKMTHFNHECIAERLVHARGSAAHGVFKLFEPLAQYSKIFKRYIP